MIVRLGAGGKSFKGLSAYLTHDPNAETSERVAWTHTLNCANDHVPSAVDEMLWTARDAELLKQEAGIRAGGRATENPVKHVSLNWAPGEQPTREEMIAATEDFLQHMRWQEHQALLVAHTDKPDRAHVHAMINMVHPDTGLKLDDNFERRRAQAWALEYEREHGMIYCGQRLLRPEERQAAPTREAWLAFEEERRRFAAEDKARADGFVGQATERQITQAEWQMLKEIQRQQREQFFADGKAEFSSLRSGIYQEIREEFRDRWREFYGAQKNGGDADELKAQKDQLLEAQRGELSARRDEACAGLRDMRDGQYRALLDQQRADRQELRGWRESGFDEARLAQILEGGAASPVEHEFRAAATEVARLAGAAAGRELDVAATTSEEAGEQVESQSVSAAHLADHAAFDLGGRFLNFFGGLLLEFGETPAPPRRRNEDVFQQAADEAGQRQQYERQREADEEWRDRERTRVWD